MEVIPFQEFMKGPAIQTISPDPGILHNVDVGWKGSLAITGVVLTLVLLQKTGVSVNETLLKCIMIGSIIVFMLVTIFGHGFLHHVRVGW